MFEHFLHIPFIDTWIRAILWGAFYFATSVFACRLLRKASKQIEDKFRDPTEIHFVVSLVQTLVYLIALVLYSSMFPALKTFGLTLLASASILSVTVGFAAQNTLSNLVAGILLMVYHPIKEDDVVLVSIPTGTTEATVAKISLGYTTLLDKNGNEILVPNNTMVNNTIVRVVK